MKVELGVNITAFSHDLVTVPLSGGLIWGLIELEQRTCIVAADLVYDPIRTIGAASTQSDAGRYSGKGQSGREQNSIGADFQAWHRSRWGGNSPDVVMLEISRGNKSGLCAGRIPVLDTASQLVGAIIPME